MNHQILAPMPSDPEKHTLVPEGDLFRIRALRDVATPLGVVKTGKWGGLVSGLSNLSQEGNCWVWPDARVLDDARVEDNGQVCGSAWLRDRAMVGGHGKAGDNVWMWDDARVLDSATVCDSARLSGTSEVTGKGSVYGMAFLTGRSLVEGRALVCGQTKLHNATVAGNSEVYGNAVLCNGVYVGDDVNVFGNAHIAGGRLLGKATIHQSEHIPVDTCDCPRNRPRGHRPPNA